MNERSPFVMRAVHGEERGKYYAGYDDKTFSAIWCDKSEDAEKLSPEDAVSVTMALIDTQLVAAIPEVYGDATNAERVEYSRICALEMWQPREGKMADIIVNMIRDSADEPIFDQSELPAGGPGYMSVWEWLSRVMEAKGPNSLAEVGNG